LKMIGEEGGGRRKIRGFAYVYFSYMFST
jgi:hypothetical protein